MEDYLLPNREQFAADPFGYSALAWQRWAIAQNLAGIPVDVERPPTSKDLKSPVLWLTQAHAMSEAAVVVLRSTPSIGHLPDAVKGVCDSQYCAAGMMLLGYSLEICLKAMLIMKHGVDEYTTQEKSHHHHKLEELAEFIPELSEKGRATLKALSHFTYWAGRYPDPGSGREGNVEEIFSISENHQVSAAELMRLAARVMAYSRRFTDAE